jgi:Tfp pilus assembly protein PilN
VQAVNKLEADFSELQQNLQMVDTLVAGSRKWSTTLNMINNRVQNVNSLWITSVNSVGGGLRIEGNSLYRNRITQFVEVFDKAILDQVNLTTVREKELYQFTVSVQSIVDDKARFAPEQNRKIRQLLSQR